jgi:hypothetical protein
MQNSLDTTPELKAAHLAAQRAVGAEAPAAIAEWKRLAALDAGNVHRETKCAYVIRPNRKLADPENRRCQHPKKVDGMCGVHRGYFFRNGVVERKFVR